MPNEINTNSLASIFNRVDTNKDRAIDENEIENVAKNAGISGGGFIGRAKMKAIKSNFMDNFDTNQNGRVSLSEFKQNGKNLLPPAENSGVSLEQGIRGFTTKTFDKIDLNENSKLDRQEVEDYVRVQLNNADVSMAATKADVAARLAVELLDANKDNSVSRTEIQELVQDIINELNN